MASFAVGGIEGETRASSSGQIPEFTQKLVTAHPIQITAATVTVKVRASVDAHPMTSPFLEAQGLEPVLEAQGLERQYTVRRGMFKGSAVLQAVCETLPGVSPADRQAALALARSGPPREAVGLDPYDPRLLPFVDSATR